MQPQSNPKQKRKIKKLLYLTRIHQRDFRRIKIATSNFDQILGPKVTIEDKRVVLGGTSGIGLAVAEAAMTEGSDVAVVSSEQSRVHAASKLLGEEAECYAANLPNENRCGSGYTTGQVVVVDGGMLLA
jgi:predicted ATP-dependent serine protease